MHIRRLGHLLGSILIKSLLYAGSSGQTSSAIGQYNPTQAIKIMDAELSRGKNLQQAFKLMIKNKAFDESKAYITFIREESMKAWESAPHIFKNLWLEQ